MTSKGYEMNNEKRIYFVLFCFILSYVYHSFQRKDALGQVTNLEYKFDDEKEGFDITPMKLF